MDTETFGELIDGVLAILQKPEYGETGVAAQGTITVSGGLPSADETFTIGDETYTFKASRGATYEVTVGADAAACVTNIATAVNADSGIVAAEADTENGAVTITALNAGIAWNRLVFSENASNLTMDGSGYLGETTAGVCGDMARKSINEGLRHIAERVSLPELEVDSTVSTNTSQSYVNLPTDYYRNLHRVYNETQGSEVDIYASLDLLLQDFEGSIDEAGAITGVTLRGSYLHYQSIPESAETLRLYYNKVPALLSELGDRPTCLPAGLAWGLLVNYAVADIFGQIEKAVDGVRQNTAFYWSRFEKAMLMLGRHLTGRTRPVYQRPEGHWI